jgi:GAF domain-containing protein
MREILERLVIRQRESATILRAHQRHGEAYSAERWASRVDLTLNQPETVERMRSLTARLAEAPDRRSLLEAALEGAISLTAADLGNIQLVDARGTLRIIAQDGFGGDFLEHFGEVDDDTSACGRAAFRHAQMVIADVKTDPAFAPHRSIACASGFRSVQSTPIVDRTGSLRGVISTHFRRPGRPESRELHIVDWYADHLAAILPMPERMTPATALYASRGKRSGGGHGELIAAPRPSMPTTSPGSLPRAA